MATRLKTVEYWFPMLQSVTDAVDTNLTQITVYLPESSKVFKKVLLDVVAHDRNTTLGNISRHQCSIQLASAGYTSVNNANAITNGGEQQTIAFSGDFTSYFQTNWTGTSMTCDARVLLDSAVATPLDPAFNNVSARLVVTYEYDGTSSTHVKTVRIPLNMKVTTQDTAKGSATDTIPALDTELPEASKTYRQIVLVQQGNDNGASTDLTFNMQVDSYTAFASGAYEHGSNCAMFIRMNWIEAEMTTASTHSYYAWVNANGNHMQAWMVVTYEFDATSSNDIYVSLLLPIQMDAPMGGTTASDYQRAQRTLAIPESGITQKQTACYMFWDQLAAISTLQWRLGSGSFTTYTDAAAVLAGNNACMIRDDAAFTLAQGRNTLSVDCWRSDTADLGYNVSGFFIVNYTADKPSGGHGAENHSVEWPLSDTGTAAVAVDNVISAQAVTIPEADYYIVGLGTWCRYVPSGAVANAGNAVGVERLSGGEGGLVWESVYADLSGTDGETGIYNSWSQAREIFERFPGDADPNRIDLETSRRWRWAVGQSVASRGALTVLLTYHAMTFSVSGTVSGSAGGTVTLDMFRSSTVNLNEKLKSTTRAGNGTYSFTWYVPTDDLFVVARESGSLLGRSDTGNPV